MISLQTIFIVQFTVKVSKKAIFVLYETMIHITIQAIGTGIFLYITFAEILFPELKNKQDMRYKIPCICIGILIIGLASLLHSHSHGGEHNHGADSHLDELELHQDHDHDHHLDHD